MVEEFKEEGIEPEDLSAALLKLMIGEEDKPERDENKRRPKVERSQRGKMVRLFVNLGKKDKLRPGDIVGAFTAGTEISGSEIGAIDIFDKYSFVEVPENVVDLILAGMHKNQIKGKRVNIEIAGK